MRSVIYTYCKVRGRSHAKAMQFFINDDERPAAESTQDTWRHAVHWKSISYRQSCWGLGSTANLHQEATVSGRRTATYAACGATICLRLGCCETVGVFNWPPRTTVAERRCAQIENGARIHKSGPVAFPWDTHNGLGGKIQWSLSSVSTAHPGWSLPSPSCPCISAAASAVFGNFRTWAAARRANRRQPSADGRPMAEARPPVAKANREGRGVRVRARLLARLRWQEWPDMIVNYLCGLFSTWPATCGPCLNSKP